MWWPNPEAINELTVEETPEGFSFSAPEGSECSKWLEHFNQTEELRQEFSKAIIDTILKYIEKEKSCGST